MAIASSLLVLRKKPQRFSVKMKKIFRTKQNSNITLQPKPMPSLVLCLVMDILGYATYAVPFLGEFLDIIWAPLSALIFMRMFGGAKGLFGGIFNFFEELMPGLDFIPTFTITWFIQYFSRNKEAYKLRPFTR
jgi:hypothetical protein